MSSRLLELSTMLVSKSCEFGGGGGGHFRNLSYVSAIEKWYIPLLKAEACSVNFCCDCSLSLSLKCVVKKVGH